MNRPTPPRSTIGRLLTLMLSVGLTACGAQDGDATFSEIALPTFSTDRVAQEAPVEARRLLSGGDGWGFESMSPSPDGRYLIDIFWGDWGGDLEIVDLEAGEHRLVTPERKSPEPDFQYKYDFPYNSVFSPDGGRIAYSWANHSSLWQYDYEVRSIGVDGSDVKVHFRFDGEGSPEVADWSRDGRYLLVNTYPEEEDAHIAIIDVSTNEYRVLKTVEVERRLGSSFFSPDGRFVAFDLRPDPSSPERDIFLVSTDGSHETALIQTPDQERLLGWLPDGSGILFHRTAEDSRAVWKLPMRAGRPAAPPELVKDDVWQMSGIGFSDDAYFYGVTVSRPGVHTASFDLETGRLLEPFTPLSEASGPQNGNPAWSPDGTRIAYAERGEDGVSHIIVRSVTGELLQDLPVALDVRVPSRNSAWTAHGFLTRGTDRDGRNGFHLISLETGDVRYMAALSPDRRPTSHTVSEDGSRIFGVSQRNEGPIIEYEIATGTERPLDGLDAYAQVRFSGRDDRRASVSPDGDKIVSVAEGLWGGDIEIFTRSSGETRVIQGFSAVNDFGFTWSPDSRYVFFEGSQDPAPNGWPEWCSFGGSSRCHLLQISVADGSVRDLSTLPQGVKDIRVSPDGRHIALYTGKLRQEIWRMTFNSGG